MVCEVLWSAGWPGRGFAVARRFVRWVLLQGLSFMIGEMGVPMDHIAILSIGTGTAVSDLRKGVLKEGRRGWGMLEWILPNQGNLVTTIMDGTAEAGQAIVEVLFRVSMCTLLQKD